MWFRQGGNSKVSACAISDLRLAARDPFGTPPVPETERQKAMLMVRLARVHTFSSRLKELPGI